ncbi:putative Thiamine pyrophosphate protein [Streptomyces viridochromogenes Tue57]|uniref:Putative Thiamine pyrophosphate protein n=1 Tax=Streptomyces viridochromogenes Tue57 TaxID=1160705 RepID=L8P4D6_STRVR|nr:putative Thiamine pyrophosphate protein [Streptomyces viridochromogenes Tue57]
MQEEAQPSPPKKHGSVFSSVGWTRPRLRVRSAAPEPTVDGCRQRGGDQRSPGSAGQSVDTPRCTGLRRQGAELEQVAVIIGGMAVLLALLRTPLADRWLTDVLQRLLRRFTHLDARDQGPPPSDAQDREQPAVGSRHSRACDPLGMSPSASGTRYPARRHPACHVSIEG